VQVAKRLVCAHGDAFADKRETACANECKKLNVTPCILDGSKSIATSWTMGAFPMPPSLMAYRSRTLRKSSINWKIGSAFN
jgi:hypothetical protein